MSFDDIHKFMKKGRLHKVLKLAGVTKEKKVKKHGKQKQHRPVGV